MDWGKAKSVVIVSLLVTNLIIASFWWGGLRREEEARREAAENALEYASRLGIEFECGLPTEALKLPVLFVEYSGGEVEAGEDFNYKGYPVIISGEEGAAPSSFSPGESKGSVGMASAALYKLISDLRDDGLLDGAKIESIDLVYWLDRSGFSDSAGGGDTAIPAWRFKGSFGVYYIYAFPEPS